MGQAHISAQHARFKKQVSEYINCLVKSIKSVLIEDNTALSVDTDTVKY